MILPGQFALLLLLLAAGMVCSGIWANTFKASGGKWRFELYYFDLAIGLVLAATIAAFTFGSLGFDGFSFLDDLRLAGKRQDVFGMAGGVVFNLGNMLLLAAVSVTGMTIAFPAAWGFALIVASGWSFALVRGGNSGLLLAGIVMLLAALIADMVALRIWSSAKRTSAGEAAAPAGGKQKRRKTPKTTDLKGIFLSLASGLMLGSYSPLLRLAAEGENGLGPYSTAFMLALGVFFSTFVYNLFFMNLPVQGEPIDIAEYFHANISRHGSGILGGMLLYIGIISNLIGPRVEGAAKVGPSLAYALTQGAPVIAALCGLFIWKELAGADARVKTYMGLVLGLLVIGIALVSTATATPAL